MKPAILFALTIFLLTACSSPTGSQPALTATRALPSALGTSALPTPMASLAARTLTRTLAVPVSTISPVPSVTLLPTKTPAPPIVTLLPTIHTFAPTFDVRTIVTVTPAPKANCPDVTLLDNPDMGFLDFSNGTNYELAGENVLAFLNKFGPNEIVKKLGNVQANFDFQDVTNDGIPELMLTAKSLYIFGCIGGRYVVLFEIAPGSSLSMEDQIPSGALISVKDVNRDGIPEITLLTRISFGSLGLQTYEIYRWDGREFAFITEDNIMVFFTGGIYYEDIDGDTIQELIVHQGLVRNDSERRGQPEPFRDENIVYRWNGQSYIKAESEFSEPSYRFQAVQDGDQATMNRKYAKAIDLYQQAIFSNELKPYSPEIHDNLLEIWRGEDKPSPTPPPTDPTEYLRLAAYAYYRMVILHTALSQTDAAQLKYATLQEKFPAGNPGHPYTEMATVFWDAYQSAGKMYDACAAAIAYADAHPEILTPLGSDYHGAQSHTYEPADVCPFR